MLLLLCIGLQLTCSRMCPATLNACWLHVFMQYWQQMPSTIRNAWLQSLRGG
jgi:hypothetical protein